MRGSMSTPEGRRIRWVRSRRTRGACTTCTATCGSGARTGSGIGTTPRRRWTIPRVRQEARTGCTGAAVGATTRPTAGRRTATGTTLATATRTTASASRGQYALLKACPSSPAKSGEEHRLGPPQSQAVPPPRPDTPTRAPIPRLARQAYGPRPTVGRRPIRCEQSQGTSDRLGRVSWTPVVLTNSIGMKLVLIPPGEFEMIAAADQKGARVRITKPFYLGQCEVTQEQYQLVAGRNPSYFKGEPALPVESVSWTEAAVFCGKLSGLPDAQTTGALYRLPTEAEWEYACRAGTTPRENVGEYAPEALSQYVWWKGNAQGRTHGVAQLRPERVEPVRHAGQRDGMGGRLVVRRVLRQSSPGGSNRSSVRHRPSRAWPRLSPRRGRGLLPVAVARPHGSQWAFERRRFPCCHIGVPLDRSERRSGTNSSVSPKVVRRKRRGKLGQSDARRDSHVPARHLPAGWIAGVGTCEVFGRQRLKSWPPPANSGGELRSWKERNHAMVVSACSRTDPLGVAAAAAAGLLNAEEKASVPDAGALEAAQKAASELFGGRFRSARTAADKAAVAAEMIEAALKLQDGSADQYVLLKIAREIASGAGEAAAALEAAEEQAERFDVPAAKLKAETLLAAAHQAKATAQHKAVAEAALQLVGNWTDASEIELPLSVCEAGRSAAQKARQFELVKELAAKADDLKKQRKAAPGISRGAGRHGQETPSSRPRT